MSKDLDVQILDALQEIGGRRVVHLFTGTVKAVDEDKRLMTVERDGVDYINVRLQASSGANEGTVLIPKLNSLVTVGRIESMNNYVMLNATKLDKIITDCESIVFNGGNNNGLVKLKELSDNLEQIKSFIQAMHTAIPQALFSVGIGSAANGTTGQNSYDLSMVGKSIVLKDMENPKIKH